jgi:hypothetical protein
VDIYFGSAVLASKTQIATFERSEPAAGVMERFSGGRDGHPRHYGQRG